MGNPAPGKPIHQLCSAEMHEYASEPFFHTNSSYVGLFPTFDESGVKTFRPTNEGCLMRNMQSHSFCPVCKEGLWINLLKRIDLIDAIEKRLSTNGVKINVKVLELGEFRKVPVEDVVESYSTEWLLDGITIPSLDNSFQNDIAKNGQKWEFRVSLRSSQVRKDDDSMHSHRSFVV